MVRTATLRTSIFNLVSTVVGGGVLSLPFTFSVMGVVFGPLALVASAAMSDFSIYLLLSMSRRQGDLSYEDVAAKTLGEPARVLLLVLLFLLTFLCAAAYFVLAADLLQPLLTAFVDTSLSNHLARFYVMVGFMCVVGPLSFFRQLNALRFTSFLSILSISVLGMVLFYKLVTATPTHFIIHPSNATNVSASFVDMYGVIMAGSGTGVGSAPIGLRNGTVLKHIKVWPNSFNDFMYALPISTVAYLCHFNVLPTNKELIKPTKKRIQRMIHSTIGICLSLYIVIAFCGYLFSLDLTCGDILNNYKNDDPIISVGRVGLVITLAMSFPLLVLPCRTVLGRLIVMFCCSGKHKSVGGSSTSKKHTESTRLLSKTDEHLLSNPVAPAGLLSPIGTFITDSPANISARYNESLRNNYRTINESGENRVAHHTGGAADSGDDFLGVSNPTLAQGRSTSEQRASSTASVSQDSDDGATLALPIHVALTIFILAGSSQIALHVSSVVQIWSILGSSISIIIAYIIPCLMYISLRRQHKLQHLPGANEPHKEMEVEREQVLDNMKKSSTLLWAWMLLIFATIASVCSTWQAIKQIKRPNCQHSIKVG